MESNCWASEIFLSVDLLEILLSVGREKCDEIIWVSTKGSLQVFVSWDFSQKLFFFERFWRNHDGEMLASNLIAGVKMEVEFHFSFVELNARRGKILLSVEMLNKFPKCRLLRLSSMMRGKRCFFSMCRFEEFSKSHDARKKNVDGSKFMRQMFWCGEALSYRRIEAWTVFLLSVSVPDEDYSLSSKLSSSSNIFARR